MLSNIKKRTEGFTIIEVLIVLAIAGLILLIVFLAVPALQRNSRNTQRKNEISSILGAVNEYANNNSGALPSTSTQQADALKNAKLSFYNGNVTWGSAGANSTTKDTAVIVTGANCTTGGATGSSSARQVAVMYTLEAGSGDQKACQDS